MQKLWIGGGCFWGVQAYFKQIKGIIKTEVGYLNGNSEKTTYEKVCNGSGHVEVVKLVYDPELITLKELFDLFMGIINPFQVNGQGNDHGIQYRVGLYSKNELTLVRLQQLLTKWEAKNGKSEVEIEPVKNYIIGEKEHQFYLAKNPGGYCHINLTKIPEKFKKDL